MITPDPGDPDPDDPVTPTPTPFCLRHQIIQISKVPNFTMAYKTMLTIAEANIIDRYRADRAVAAAVVHLTKIWLADLQK